jgi:hypothetical protein
MSSRSVSPKKREVRIPEVSRECRSDPSSGEHDDGGYRTKGHKGGRGIYNASDVDKNNLLGSFPLLKGEMLEVDVMGSQCGQLFLTIKIAAALSLNSMVGPSCGYPSSERINQRYSAA